jgi:hypothetical protein
MEYTTNLNCSISIFHQSLSVAAIESAIGRKALRSTNRGDVRPSTRSAPFDRSSAHFTVAADGERDPQKAISDCLDIIEKSADIDVLRQAALWIILGLLDPGFVQVVICQDLIERLSRTGVALAIENRTRDASTGVHVLA